MIQDRERPPNPFIPAKAGTQRALKARKQRTPNPWQNLDPGFRRDERGTSLIRDANSEPVAILRDALSPHPEEVRSTVSKDEAKRHLKMRWSSLLRVV